jgi:hypothetical protein
MGNRAVITFDQTNNAPCIYLHWNGGRASVEGFLEAARNLGLRRAERGQEHQVLDNLAGLVARHFFGGEVGLTVYRETYGRADKDNGDNGVYLLNRDLTIGGRLFARAYEEVNPTKTREISEHIVQRAAIFNQ